MPRRLVLALVAALAVAACNEPPANEVDDAALDAIGETVEASLNEPGEAIIALLKGIDGPRPIGIEAMLLVLDQRAVPLDWWLWRRGFLQQLDLATTRPTFLLTDQARQIAAAEPLWFEVEVDEPSEVNCETPAAVEALGCEVDVTVTPALTAAGRALAMQPTLQPFSVHVLVAPAADGWEVRDLRTGGAALHDIALGALLGPEQSRDAARAQVMAELDITQTLTTAIAPADLRETAAPLEALPEPDLAPVAPVIGDSPHTPSRPRVVP